MHAIFSHKSFTPIKIILSILVSIVVFGHIAGAVAGGDNSFDAGGFMWGTEIWPNKNINYAENAVNDILKTKYIKMRIGIRYVSKDNKNFSNIACLPSAQNCIAAQYNLDDVAKIYKENGWNMIPMLSYAEEGRNTTFSSSDIENYVNFVDWFVARYKNDANIKYIELENCPNCATSLSVSKELLLEATNKIYDRIKSKYPDILIGTPGFEYWVDDKSYHGSKMVEQIEYFLDKNNGAKFDFWAFHGYGAKTVFRRKFITYPPTKSSLYNKYADIKGISEIRKKLNANGWHDRLIIETEGDSTFFFGYPYTETEEKIDAAYQLQDAVLKRTQTVNGHIALAGKFPLKILIRRNIPGLVADITGGNLLLDSSSTLPVKAIGLLCSKLNEYKDAGHISGEFDNEEHPWIEKFQSGNNKELYIFFKPFEYKMGQTISLDNKTISYILNLTKKPAKLTLTDTYGNVSNIIPNRSITIEAENAPQFLEVEY